MARVTVARVRSLARAVVATIAARVAKEGVVLARVAKEKVAKEKARAKVVLERGVEDLRSMIRPEGAITWGLGPR